MKTLAVTLLILAALPSRSRAEGHVPGVQKGPAAPAQCGVTLDHLFFFNQSAQAKLKRISAEDRVGDEERNYKRNEELFKMSKQARDAGVLPDKTYYDARLAKVQAGHRVTEAKALAVVAVQEETISKARISCAAGAAVDQSKIAESYGALWKAQLQAFNAEHAGAKAVYDEAKRYTKALQQAAARGAVPEQSVLKAEYALLSAESDVELAQSRIHGATEAGTGLQAVVRSLLGPR